jgi:hypothetical protein
MVMWQDLLTAIALSGGLAAAASWLAKVWINHLLTARIEGTKADLAHGLEAHKASLSAQLAADRAQIEGEIRQHVELNLGERAARRQYEYEARKRLYVAIGPLRLQLLLACRELAERIKDHGGWEPYDLNLSGYYGRNTLYRLARPLAIVELIEREIAFSDFGVDPDALAILRLKASFRQILCGGDVVGGHPAIDWTRQYEHLFSGSIGTIASKLIRESERGGSRVVTFAEFSEQLAADGVHSLDPLSRLVDGFNISTKPVLWIRFVAYAYSCNAWVDRTGQALGFEHRPLPTEALIRASGDNYLIEQSADFGRRIENAALVGL